jgi:hypothetical protein
MIFVLSIKKNLKHAYKNIEVFYIVYLLLPKKAGKNKYFLILMA